MSGVFDRTAVPEVILVAAREVRDVRLERLRERRLWQAA
jgi:hypothetical protein